MGAFWRGECTLRQLRVLVEHLPPDAASVRAARGHSWGDAEYLLAVIADAVRDQVAAFAKVNSKGRVPWPERIPRPDEVAAKSARREETSAAAVAYIEQYRAARGG